jgi:hypothetical protein
MNIFPIRSLARDTIPCLSALFVLLFAREASAELCSARPNPVYVNGGGSVLVESLGKLLASENTTLIYKKQGSCAAVDSIWNGTPLMGTLATANGGVYWDATTAHDCDFDAMGNIADIGISDVFPSTCSSLPNGLPSDVGDYLGPVEAYGFAVPSASTQRSISRDAAYFVFGFGADSGVEPWTDPASIFIRDVDSGTQRMLGLATGVDVAKWKGTPATSSSDLVNKLNNAADKERAIGILASEVAIENELVVQVLAYQDADQSCGYTMDSTPTTRDKANVRDGHYPIWGPFHVLTKLDANGYPLKAAAADFKAYAVGTKDPAGLDLVKVLATAGLIPECAMHVTRDTEMGPLTSFQPPRSCGCYFDSLTKGASTCTACMSNTDCPETTPACNYGYCEVK